MQINKLANAISVLTGWQIDSIAHLGKGYRNNCYLLSTSDTYSARDQPKSAVLVIYKNESDIEKSIRSTNDLAELAAKTGLEIRRPLTSIIKIALPLLSLRYACIYTYLNGQTLPWEDFPRAALRSTGSAMAQLHRNSRVLLDKQELNAGRRYRQALPQFATSIETCRNYLLREDITRALAEKLALEVDPAIIPKLYQKTTSQLAALSAESNHQQVLCHMDLVRGNLLFDPANLAKLPGLIDFEKAGLGHRSLDIARTLSFLVVDCRQKSQQTVLKNFLVKGYCKDQNQTISESELSLIKNLSTLFWVYEFYKFLRHNPYESLPQNAHFCATRDLLVGKKLIYANIKS